MKDKKEPNVEQTTTPAKGKHYFYHLEAFVFKPRKNIFLDYPKGYIMPHSVKKIFSKTQKERYCVQSFPQVKYYTKKTWLLIWLEIKSTTVCTRIRGAEVMGCFDL